jgi:uncharacterized protein YdaU (DUF1376 family)
MAAPPYMKLFWGDYHRGTRHLRHASEHGAYMLLIGALWDNDGKIGAEDQNIADHALLGLDEWVAMKPKLMPFFRIVRGKLTHKRVSAELAEFKSKSCKRKRAGKSGGEAKARNQRENRLPNATHLPTYTESDTESEDKPPNPPDGGSETGFEVGWSAYPIEGRNVAPEKAEEFWGPAVDRAGSPARMIVTIRAYAEHRAKLTRPPAIQRFDRWLRDGAFAAFLPPDDAQVEAWTGPPEVWAMAVGRMGEPWAKSWIGQCAWRVEPDKALVSHNAIIIQRVRQELGAELRQMGIQLESVAS